MLKFYFSVAAGMLFSAGSAIAQSATAGPGPYTYIAVVNYPRKQYLGADTSHVMSGYSTVSAEDAKQQACGRLEDVAARWARDCKGSPYPGMSCEEVAAYHKGIYEQCLSPQNAKTCSKGGHFASAISGNPASGESNYTAGAACGKATAAAAEAEALKSCSDALAKRGVTGKTCALTSFRQ